jgi:hypothetical protein
MSKEWHKTPAELYFIHDEFKAWCFNRAVYTFGSAMQEDLETTGTKSKNEGTRRRQKQMAFNKWMYAGLSEVPQRRFADPMAKMKKKVEPNA